MIASDCIISHIPLCPVTVQQWAKKTLTADGCIAVTHRLGLMGGKGGIYRPERIGLHLTVLPILRMLSANWPGGLQILHLKFSTRSRSSVPSCDANPLGKFDC